MVRQYIGARYVPKIYENSLDPSSSEWEQTSYEPLIVVTYNNSSYISKKAVPATVGNPVDNPDYWCCAADYNAQVAQLQNDVADLKDARTYKGAAEVGLVNDGATDNAPAFTVLTDNVALKAGTYKISTSCIITANIVFCGGAKLDIDPGITVTFKKQILANPDEQIFTGSGSVVIPGYAYPEWFGAVVNTGSVDCSSAINKAYSSADELRLNGGRYYVENTVLFNKSGVKVSGIGNGRSFDNINSQSCIVTNDTDLTIVKIGNGTGLWNGLYENFGVFRLNPGVNGAIGFEIKNTLMCTFNHLFSRSATAFECDANVTPIFNECRAFPRGVENGSTWLYGWHCPNEENNVVAGSIGNVSMYILNCFVEGASPTSAVELAFQWLNGGKDLFIDGFESSYCQRGIEIAGTSDIAIHDMSLHRIVIDNYTNYAVRIHDSADTQLVIDGGYFYGGGSAFMISDVLGHVLITHTNTYMSDLNANPVYRIINTTGVTMRDNICKCNQLINGTDAYRLISEDAVIPNNNVDALIAINNTSHSKFILNVGSQNHIPHAVSVSTMYSSIIDATGIYKSDVDTALVSIGGVDYNAIGVAGTNNEITGLYN